MWLHVCNEDYNIVYTLTIQCSDYSVVDALVNPTSQ